MRISASPLTFEEPEPSTPGDWLLTPILAFLAVPIRIWLVVCAAVLCVLGLLGWELSRSNSDLAGLARPNFSDFTFSDNYKRLTRLSDGTAWGLSYEPRSITTFVGTVRHVEHWHDAGLPFMTHDVLVTTRDYADSRLVTTNVFDHHFSWWADETPTGTINLLHIAPLSEAIYDELLLLKNWQTARLTGPEILRIDFLDDQGHPTGAYWQDAGCNSILITGVEITTP